MEKRRFSIAYDGPALADGGMSVRDLAPALMSIGELFEEANEVLHGDSAVVDVYVKATRKGSFEVTFEMVQGMLPTLMNLVKGEPVTAEELWTLIFGAGSGGGSAAGLFALIKFLRGRALDKAKTKEEGGTVRIEHDGQIIETTRETVRTYESTKVRRAVDGSIAQPLSREGIETVAVRDQGGRKVLDVPKADRTYYEATQADAEIVAEDRLKRAYSIVSLTFTESNMWRLHDGNTIINARIADQGFWKKVHDRSEEFAEGDQLVCEVLIVQTNVDGKLRTDHTIERILEHRKPSSQMPLFENR